MIFTVICQNNILPNDSTGYSACSDRGDNTNGSSFLYHYISSFYCSITTQTTHRYTSISQCYNRCIIYTISDKCNMPAFIFLSPEPFQLFFRQQITIGVINTYMFGNIINTACLSPESITVLMPRIQVF